MILLDFETTGLVGPDALPLEKQPQIIEATIALLDDKTLKEKARETMLIKPTVQLTPEITRITGLKDADLVDARPFAFYYPTFVKMWIGQTLTVAHNCAFESSLIEFELRRIGKQFMFPWTPRRLCTVEASVHLKKRRLRLGELYEIATNGGKIQGAHRTEADVTGLAVCLRWLKEKGHVKL
jgi:DNA polymerase III epsilon subunit-like protein